MKFDFLVIGSGLIGSAAARYLSQSGQRVCVIGPSEPEIWQQHRGPFASHYDEGRITRELDSDWMWAKLAQRSIAEYRRIEQAADIRFYHPCGSVQVGKTAAEYINKTAVVGQKLTVQFETFSAADFRNVCSTLRFPNSVTCLWEPPVKAGYINPRTLITAQKKIARSQGAQILDDFVTAVRLGDAAVAVETNGGHHITANKVLIAAGAYTPHLTSHAATFKRLPRTILLARLSAAEATRLKHMPSVVYYDGLEDDRLSGIYALPPIPYPDGHTYLKIGGKLKNLEGVTSAVDLLDWFHSAGSKEEAQALESVLFDLVPGLKAESLMTKPCVVTYTPHQRPLIDIIEPGKLYVAAGGCGAGAKSSNEIGRAAALMVQQDGWNYDIEWENFRPH